MHIYLAGCDAAGTMSAVMVALTDRGAVPVLPSSQALDMGMPDLNALAACWGLLRVSPSSLGDAEVLAARVLGMPVYDSLRACLTDLSVDRAERVG